MTIERDINDVRKLLRAYALLTGCCDDQRALVGRVSRHWIGAETERLVVLNDLPEAALMTPRGREILAVELYGDPDVGPDDIGPEALQRLRDGPPIQINSNRLPKLEPAINAAVLAGVMLTGIQMYGAGGRGRPDIDNDLVIATLLQPTLDGYDRLSHFDPVRRVRVDAQLVEQRFGRTVAERAELLREAQASFDRAFDRDGEFEPICAQMSNPIAALAIARLRLSARAAGDRIFDHLNWAQRNEVSEVGVDLADPWAESGFLRRDYRRALAALGLPGVDRSALREPIGNTLMVAVADALEDPGKAERLVGRRGKGVHDVHLNLPLMEYYNAAESPDRLATLHVAALELMRYLDKCRRKSFVTMLGHAFQIAGILENAYGEALDPSFAVVALLHDVVEDGAGDVAGYDQSLQKLRLRFGGPLTAMVSEVTDSGSRLDGPLKARTTCQHPALLTPRRQYDVSRFTEMRLHPTDAQTPYTLAGIAVKLADTIATEDEGLRDPDLMSGWWQNSGIRIYWAQNVRGPIVAPLEARLVEEIERAEKGAYYSQRENAVPAPLLAGLKSLLLAAFRSHDLYAGQNLLILGDEFGLDLQEHEQLQQCFFDAHRGATEFSELVDTLLPDERLSSRYAGENRSRVILYRRAENQPRDAGTLLDYRAAAVERRRLLHRMGRPLEPDDALLEAMADVTANYRRLSSGP